MPLVNTLQISQDLGRDVPPPPAVQMDMFKMAGSTAALAELGLISSEEMEKEAWAGLVGKALPWLWKGVKGIGSLFRSGAATKATQAAGAAAKPAGLWARTGGRAMEAVARPFGNFGKNVTQRVGSRLGASPETIAKIQGLGKGMAGEAIGFGALGGGIEAAMAEPGQRGSAFMRGFGSGALGGLAFRGAGNLATAGLRKGLGAGAGGAARLKSLDAAKGQKWFGKLEPGQSRLKGWGAKALMGGVPFAAGMGASMYTPHFSGGQQQPQTGYQQYAQPAARLGAGIAMPRIMGAFPGGPGYNPNLPLPQGRY